jgi:ubiquinone/menaquinone biosynthesis C-methylase UbiE
LAGFSQVLDIGCGSGLYSIAFSLSGSNVIAVDFSSSSLSVAKAMSKFFGAHIDFRESDLFTYSDTRKYDLVFCNGVLHHTGNARYGFYRISRFVKQGGLLAVGLYNRGFSPIRLSKWFIKEVAKEDLESRRVVAQALFSTPLPYLAFGLFHRAGAGFSGAEVKRMTNISDQISTMRKSYVERLPNLIDLVCHMHTSYHTPNEVRRWYSEEGFSVINQVPASAGLKGVLVSSFSNYIFYVGRKLPPLSFFTIN